LNAAAGKPGRLLYWSAPPPLPPRPDGASPTRNAEAGNNGAMLLTLFYALRVDRRLFALCTAFGLLQLLKHFEVLLGFGRFAEFSQNIA